MKHFYIIMSTIGTFLAMDFIYSGEFSPSQGGGVREHLPGKCLVAKLGADGSVYQIARLTSQRSSAA